MLKLDPTVFENVPLGHLVQFVAPTPEYQPLGHKEQFPAPEPEKLPAAHIKQAVEELAPNVGL